MPKTKEVIEEKTEVAAAPKAVKKTVAKAEAVAVKETKTATVKAQPGLTLDVVDTKGVATEKITLPEAVFGVKVNKELIAQAVRVYLVNQRRGTVATKSRGEVDGSTRKIYRQKGTGRARHGGIRAPIFVKGGIAHGPKQKNYELSMSKQMRKAAFVSALSSRLSDGAIMVVAGVEKLAPKTKNYADMFAALTAGVKKRNILFVMPKHSKEIYTASRNCEGVEITSAAQLNTYEVLAHKKIVFMQDAIAALVKGSKE